MRFRFLGTGTSSGVPAIACDCAVCTSTDPRDTRLRTGACVEFTDVRGRERVVLIDATPDLRQQALAAKLRRCDAIVFTHNHVDHVFGLDEVRRFNAVQQSPIEVYAEPHTMDSLRRVYQHIFDVDKNINDSFVATLIAHPIAPQRTIDIFGMLFTPIRLLHGRLPIVGFRIEPDPSLKRHHEARQRESLNHPTSLTPDLSPQSSGSGKSDLNPRSSGSGTPELRSAEVQGESSLKENSSLRAEGATDQTSQPNGSASPSTPLGEWGYPFPLAYCTDVSAIPPESWSSFEGVRTLVLDALRHRKHPTHMTINEAVNAADRIGARDTWFVHMSHDLGHAETDEALPEGMRLAYDGLVLGSGAAKRT